MRYLMPSALLFLNIPASAATFCAETVQELQNALTSAQSNGEDDTIRLATGTYLLDEKLVYSTGENFSLTLVGGYLSVGSLQCLLWFPDPANTVLDGQGQTSLIELHGSSGSGAIGVGHLTFRNGVGTDEHPVFIGGFAGYSGAVTIQSSVFENLAGRSDAGYTAVQISVDRGSLAARDNVFAGNTTDSGLQPVDLLINAAPIAPLAPTVNPNGGFNNNTVTGNGGGYAIGLRGSGFWSAANNVIWGNENGDVTLGAHVALYDNDIGTYQGTPDSETGGVSIDPRFVDAANGNYRLRADSPLIDEGIGDPYGGVGTYDAGGRERIVFAAVDIGAYELQDPIFSDGFD